MATYESQRIRETEQKENPFSELLQMITAVSAMGERKREGTNTVYQSAMNDIGKDILNSFDDVTYEANVRNLDDYYNRNLDKLDSD